MTIREAQESSSGAYENPQLEHMRDMLERLERLKRDKLWVQQHMPELIGEYNRDISAQVQAIALAVRINPALLELVWQSLEN